MHNTKKSNRLIELTTRAISVSKELLNEEEKFIEAVSVDNAEIQSLKAVHKRIVTLARKERLYLGAAQSLLQDL